jgi:hypothetical protein
MVISSSKVSKTNYHFSPSLTEQINNHDIYSSWLGTGTKMGRGLTG